jgi:hypothetical protein
MRHKFLQIGNAVPPPVGLAVGAELRALIEQRKKVRKTRKGVIACESADFLRRLAARPRTVLDPPRMRAVKGLAETRRWMASASVGTRDHLDLPVLDPREAG